MKYPLFFIFCLSFFFKGSVYAQFQVEPAEKEFQVMNDFEIASGKMSDSKYMFKLTTPGGSLRNLSLGVEYKILKSFSLGAYIDGASFYSLVQQESDTIIIFEPFELEFERAYELSARLEGRYYLNHESLIDLGFGNNLNGIYAIGGVKTQLYNSVLNEESYAPYMGVGVQSRILKYGLIDVALLASYENDRFSIFPELKAGFAFSKDYKLLEIENAKCNILRCFDEKKFQFKLPLKSLLFVNYIPDINFVSVNFRPRIEIEHRLLRGLSMNHSFSASSIASLNLIRDIRSRITQADFGYANGIRYYFLKKRNIAKGKSADNLSGPYVASSFSIGQLYWNSLVDNEWMKRSTVYYGGIDLGYQARLFKKFYFDFNVYLGRQSSSVVFNVPANTNEFITRYGFNFDFGMLL